MDHDQPTNIQELLRLARARFDALTPTEQRAERDAQRRSFVRGEMGIGSDAVEDRRMEKDQRK